MPHYVIDQMSSWRIFYRFPTNLPCGAPLDYPVQGKQHGLDFESVTRTRKESLLRMIGLTNFVVENLMSPLWGKLMNGLRVKWERHCLQDTVWWPTTRIPHYP